MIVIIQFLCIVLVDVIFLLSLLQIFLSFVHFSNYDNPLRITIFPLTMNIHV